MPKTTSKVASKSKSKSQSPYASSSRAPPQPKHVTFDARERDPGGSSSESDDEEYQSPPDELIIRDLFLDKIKGWPEEKVQRFEDYMRSPYDMSPIPSRSATRQARYYFGYYISYSDLCKFSEELNADWPEDPTETTPDPGAFLESVLNVVMLEGRRVRLRSAWVREEDKERFPRIKESVGEACLVIVVLSMLDYRQGCRPTNFEVKEITNLLRRKPIWWKGA
ncbi:hypothetical protein EIP91_001630 [Steccherinum ochraceum]|uniref:Uncharacterized protein n=1 Tax=Steccherinum ochraceum TaxID=92696 RepID=A0A4V2MWH1_9APHY|nr:hypothetical protein EIP91_001630 [Steccherinum ochraceum]